MMKKERLFSIKKEGQLFDDISRKGSLIMETPQFRQKLRSMRKADGYRASSEFSIPEAPPRDTPEGFKHREAPVRRHIREKLRKKKTKISQGIISKTITGSSPTGVISRKRMSPVNSGEALQDSTSDILDGIMEVSVQDSTTDIIDGIMEAIGHDYDFAIYSDDEYEESDSEEEVKVNNFDPTKRSSFSKGDKRKNELLMDNVWATADASKESEDELLLDNVWAIAEASQHVIRNGDVSSGDEESLDEDEFGELDSGYESNLS